MPTVNIRETISGLVETDAEGNGYFTKRINVPDDMRNQILSIDVYNDNVVPWIQGPETKGVQVFISPFPIQRTLEAIEFGAGGLPLAGPKAGDDTVLYKETTVYNLDDYSEQPYTKVWTDRFPNDAVGATPTSSFYSPHLYLTVLLWNEPLAQINLSYSVYLRVEQKKCSIAESSMGKYGEFLDAQCRLLTQTAVVTPSNLVAGNTWPTWKFGGIRPELMISGSTALRYYNRVAANANQDMTTRAALQAAFEGSTGMVGFDEAFGDAANNLPEWISLLDVGGITSGAIRPYPPPLKYADNGNTLMF